MTTRASIILWSAGSGVLLGLFADAALIGIWMVMSSLLPTPSFRQSPRWLTTIALLFLAAIPVVAGILGYLEGRLKGE